MLGEETGRQLAPGHAISARTSLRTITLALLGPASEYNGLHI